MNSKLSSGLNLNAVAFKPPVKKETSNNAPTSFNNQSFPMSNLLGMGPTAGPYFNQMYA